VPLFSGIVPHAVNRVTDTSRGTLSTELIINAILAVVAWLALVGTYARVMLTAADNGRSRRSTRRQDVIARPVQVVQAAQA
jgi:hypothetical protein